MLTIGNVAMAENKSMENIRDTLPPPQAIQPVMSMPVRRLKARHPKVSQRGAGEMQSCHNKHTHKKHCASCTTIVLDK
jgi:hypothetical protein